MLLHGGSPENGIHPVIARVLGRVCNASLAVFFNLCGRIELVRIRSRVGDGLVEQLHKLHRVCYPVIYRRSFLAAEVVAVIDIQPSGRTGFGGYQYNPIRSARTVNSRRCRIF
ncbi:hypothetical protein D3C86_1891190 [compost metagenome]